MKYKNYVGSFNSDSHCPFQNNLPGVEIIFLTLHEPDNIKSAASVNSFKNNIKRFP